MQGRGRGADWGWSTGTLQHRVGWREAVGCAEELVMGVDGQKGVLGNVGGWALVHGARVEEC